MDAFEFNSALKDAVRWSLLGKPPSEQSGFREDLPPVHPVLLEHVLRDPVVIETSPPLHFKLKELSEILRKNPTAVGAFIGYLAGAEYPPLLLITVPVGIIVVGSAPAVTEAINRGLTRLIDGFFEGKEREPAEEK